MLSKHLFLNNLRLRDETTKPRGGGIVPSVADPSIWNELPLALHLLPRVHCDTYYFNLKPAV